MSRRPLFLIASLLFSACNEPSDRVANVPPGGSDAGSEDAATEPLDASSTPLDSAVPVEDAGPGGGDAGPSCTPVSEVCNGVDDDCDGAVDEGLEIACLPDVDGDLHAAAASPTSVCPDPARDAAGYCPTGMVATASSLGEDCDDASAAVFRVASVRADADGDGYCIGAAASSCVGATAPAGSRFSTECAGVDDCRDSNAAASATCILPGAYVTSSVTKGCLGVPTTETFGVSPTSSCPAGFGLASYGAVRSSGSGGCVAVSSTLLQISCAALDGASCRIEGYCSAL